jgi:ParB-like chromosome segregation protein Spo0J
MVVQPRSSSTPTSVLDAIELIPAHDLNPNPWNPNRMTAFIYAKAVESIEQFGFVDPITAYRDEGRLVIIDGEHRWQAGMELGLTEFPVVILDVSRDQAKKLTIVLNELHGQADAEKLTDLLGDLLDNQGMAWLTEALPFTDDVLAGMLSASIDLPGVSGQLSQATTPNSKDRWVEKLLRMPEDVALMYDSAIDKAKDGDLIKDWQALERILAEFHAS